MQKTVVFFDVDGTLISGNVNTAILFYLFRKGALPPIMLLRAIFWYASWRTGLTRNIEQIARKGARELAGISEQHLRAFIDEAFHRQVAGTVYREAVEIIKRHRDQGHEVVLLSSSFEPFIQKIASYLNIPEVIATKLEIESGVYTGHIEGKIVWGNKHHIVAEFRRTHNPDKIYAYSDQFQDAPMLELVTYPVAVNPDFRLRRRAAAKGWKILRFSHS